MVEINGKDYSPEELATLAKAGVLNVGQKNDPSGNVATAAPLHGVFPGNSAQFGIMSDGRVNRVRYSALNRPKSLLSYLPMMRSEVYNPLFEILTGQTDASGDNATDWCDYPAKAGQLKTCRQSYLYGSMMLGTQINAIPMVGLVRDYADVAAEIANGAPVSPFIPDLLARLEDTRDQLAHELFTLGVQVERATAQVLWAGTQGTKNNTYLGWWEQFAGLDSQIKTGYTDSVTGLACAAADSNVQTWGTAIDGSDSNSRNIVEAVTDQYYGLTTRAEDVGMGGTMFAYVMRPELFHALVEVWACNYATFRCSGTTSSPNNRDGEAMQRRRIEMMNGSYLLINGLQVPVIQDSGITLSRVSGNTYLSDMYFVPMEWQGSALTYYDFMPMDNPYATRMQSFAEANGYEVMNNGMYLATVNKKNFCKEIAIASMGRTILRTPFLAGRIDDISFTYLAPTRSPFSGETTLYANGGVTFRS